LFEAFARIACRKDSGYAIEIDEEGKVFYKET
jgi:hypothetical protein